MPTVENTGTIVANGTEQTLATISLNRNLVAVVNLSNMAAGDTVIIKAKRKVLAGDANALGYIRQQFDGAQTDPVAISIPLPSPHQAVFTLQQTAGVNRSYPYSIESIN
jgi:hypothetical protein